MSDEFNERGVLKWDIFYERRIKPHGDKIDAWDLTIMKAIHSRWYQNARVVLLDFVKDDVTRNCGFISDEELSKRLEKLENLGMLTRMIGLA